MDNSRASKFRDGSEAESADDFGAAITQLPHVVAAYIDFERKVATTWVKGSYPCGLRLN